MLDSLRRALRQAQDQKKAIDDQVRAVGAVNWPAVAQANQSAVGLVVTYVGGSSFNGSGFTITESGYFLTNRHVVTGDNGAVADSVFVVMADQTGLIRADIASVAP